MSAKPTLVDVAADAGVSLASASRALAGGSASLKMVKRVKASAQRLGYLPDGTARSLKLGAARRITFAVDDIGNPNYVAMLRAIEQVFGAAGPHVSVSSTGRDPHVTAEFVRSLRHGFADGLIISPIRVSRRLETMLDDAPVPVVVIGSVGNTTSVDTVRVDSGLAVRMALEHLITIGRTRVAFINGPRDTNPGVARERGFYNGARELQLDIAPALGSTASDFSVAAGVIAADRLIRAVKRRKEPIDGIVAANDLIAIGAISAILKHGYRVPEDIAITGIDDTEIAAVYNPALTSVSLRSAERGRLAAELLLDRYENPGRATLHRSVAPELMVRASTVSSIS